ncbi:MAG: hypothetical protein NC250_06230 [Alistipes senegalensis]|nr:hypothetical protein [Alistipes senegalensis]
MKKFLDPFTYFSGGTTLTAGTVIMVAMIVTAHLTGQTFRSVISIGIGHLSYVQLALQLLAGWAVFSAMLYGAARWLSPSHIRLIDIAGNQALAKLPFCVLLICSRFYPIEKMMGDLTEIQSLNLSEIDHYAPSAGLILYSVVALLMVVWFFVWSYRGFAIAANLRGWRAAGSYIVCYLLAEVLAGWCTSETATLCFGS